MGTTVPRRLRAANLSLNIIDSSAVG